MSAVLELRFFDSILINITSHLPQICVKNQCTHVGRLISTTCPRAGDGKECAGKGVRKRYSILQL